MQYILGIGFYGKIYKNLPTIQVFVGDRFIDEYQPSTVDGYESYKTFIDKAWFNSLPFDENSRKRVIEMPYLPKCFKFYTLDDELLKNQSAINLHIKNADSNYANGFMTNSTLLNLSNIFLVPAKIVKHFRTTQKQPNELYNNIKDIIPHIGKDGWDVIGIAKYKDTVFKGYPFPYKYFWNNEHITDPLNYFFGGNGILRLDLVCKNNVVMFDYYENQLLELTSKFNADQYNKLANRNDDVVGLGAYFNENVDQVVAGFPISNRFFVLSRMLNFDKY